MTDLPEIHERDATTWRVREPDAHARAVRGMFTRISGVYDLLNHLLSLNLDRRWRRHVARRLDPDVWEVLDLCAGTGDLALTCRKAGRGRTFVAVDFVPAMLRRGRHKPNGDELLSAAADALRLPLPDASVDAVVIGFGLRNLADVRAGLAEMTRVLRRSGQLLVLEFFRADPAAIGPGRGPSAPIRWALRTMVPRVGRLVARDAAAYSYLPGSMGRFLSAPELVGLLGELDYEDVFIERQTLGIAHLVGGRRPGP